jgi:purine nucleosidase
MRLRHGEDCRGLAEGASVRDPGIEIIELRSNVSAMSLCQVDAEPVTLLGMKTLRILLVLIVAAMTAVAVPVINSQIASASSKAGVPPQLVIIDTDIGDDIDDAFALALALRSPELKILGVTTTFGDTELRAKLVTRFLSAVDRRDIPVLAGPATKTDNVMTQAAYARRAHMPKDETHPAGVDFILKEIKEHPGQITLIAIGPLFTVQAVIEKDLATFKKLKRVVIMGGSVYRGYDDAKTGARRPPDAEWNINRDPAGAKALLGAGVPVFMMPLDSTQVHLETKDREQIFSHGSPLTDQVALLYHQWMAGTEWHSPTPTLFDPVAVTYAFRPDLCPGKPMHIDVDDKGFTRPGEGTSNAQVCLQSDEKSFLELLLKRVAGE